MVCPDCWGHGIWNMPSNPQDNQGIGRGTPTENYEPVKATNADALVWGTSTYPFSCWTTLQVSSKVRTEY